MFIVGVVISTGMGINNLDFTDAFPSCEVKVSEVVFQDRPEPSDYLLVVEAARELESQDIDFICLIGSSRGVGPAQLALAETPELFDKYVAISGAGGPFWGVEEFIRSVSCPVLQMAGEDEQENMLRRMDLLNFYLQNYGHDAEFNYYPGKHGFLSESREAQKDLNNFICYTEEEN